jgi:hypothetical protein
VALKGLASADLQRPNEALSGRVDVAVRASRCTRPTIRCLVDDLDLPGLDVDLGEIDPPLLATPGLAGDRSAFVRNLGAQFGPGRRGVWDSSSKFAKGIAAETSGWKAPRLLSEPHGRFSGHMAVILAIWISPAPTRPSAPPSTLMY